MLWHGKNIVHTLLLRKMYRTLRGLWVRVTGHDWCEQPALGDVTFL